MRPRKRVGVVLAWGAVLALVAMPLVKAQTPPSINVDVAASRRPIDPRIYGVNFASQAQLQALNVLLNRSGGNATTRHNWQVNATNRANDWYYESLDDGSATPGASIDSFVSSTKAAGGAPMVTVPTIGWVAKLGPNRGRLSSYSIAKYGAQTGNDSQWFPDAGNGIRASDGAEITTNNPNDANVLVDSNFQKGLVQHLVATFGAANAGGVRYYILDNEPSIWFGTHRDVHNVGPTMDEIRDYFLDYGARIKEADPNAFIVGPEEWGWSGYFYSGYDQQYGSKNGWGFLPDRANHGNWDYLPWLLDQLRQHQQSTGQKLLDVFTVHYYPQGGEFWGGTDNATQLLRNRSTRSLWDPNYTDETWINDKVRLIPRLRGWANTHYLAGTPIGITEYSWGADDHINGATAQADVLGIFGREGLDLATRWVVPATASPTFKAFQMYRNYDGNKSTFGDVSVAATGPNPDQLSVFASQRTSDGALTLMAINKVLSGTTTANVNLANFTASGTAQAYRLTSSNQITRLSDVTFTGSSFPVTLPAQSITLYVLPSSSASSLSVNDVSVSEGNSGTSNASFTVSLSASSASTVTVSYATQAGTATAGSDYTTTSGSLTFTAGQTSKTVTVPVIGDTVDEADEDFFLVLSSPSNATLGDAQGKATIVDDDVPMPTVSIADAAVSEGNAGTKSLSLTLSLSASSGQPVTVNYTTANASATAGSDYSATSGSVTIAAGTTSQPLSVTVMGDTNQEADEAFTVTLSNPVGATIADGQGTGTITNDDVGATAGASEFYVTPTGSDSNDCSPALPCRQIRRALTLVDAGDTIYVANGSYLGFDVQNINGTAAQPITIKAQGSAVNVTPTTDRPDNRDTIFVTFSSNVVIDGLASFNANRAAVRVDQSPRITIRNGVFGDNATWGIFTDFSDDLLIEKNECYGSVAEHGIYVSNSGDRPVLRGNRVHDNNASGIQLNADLSAGGDGIITGALLEQNVIYNNGVNGGGSINLDGVQSSIVRNNLIYNNRNTGIVNYRGDGAQGPQGMQILHNTIDMPTDGRWAVLISNTTGSNLLRNNIIYNRHSFRGGIAYGTPTDAASTDSDYNVLDRVSTDDGSTVITLAQWQAQGHETHSFITTAANLWVNPVIGATADYHLKTGSPAIDQGPAQANATRDIENHVRPWGVGSDLGSDEFVTANFTTTQFVTGLTNPTAMQFAPDGRLFVCQQGSGSQAQLRVVKNGTLLPTPFVTLNNVDASGERGLLGIAFDPNFATNQFVYLYYTSTMPAPVHNRIIRLTANGDVATAGSEFLVLKLDNLSGATNHNGGALHFGPDGKLYVAVGENANGNNSQVLTNLLGKMLRINPNGTLPADNPFPSNRAIWTLGLRNPFTFAFQPGTGRMFINDVGQSTWEEINDGIAGANYGWPGVEGPNPPGVSGRTYPLMCYAHGSTTLTGCGVGTSGITGCAITGGTFYNPSTVQFPADFIGDFFFADFCSGWIYRFDPAGGTPAQFVTGISSPVDLKIGADGSLYYLARGQGRVYRVQNVASQAPVITGHPANVTVTVGNPSAFTVTAAGAPTLTYQWQRNMTNIAGATSPTYTISSAQASDNGARFRCIVSNSQGNATSNEALLTVTSNTAPTATITQPPQGTLYTAGDTINYAGTGTDTEDGNLPASAFTWQVDFHHDTHTHPFVPATSGATSGSFTIPTSGETASNVWYRIHLTVRDSGQLTHAVFRDVTPRTARVTLQTNPTGLQLLLDGQPQTTPVTFTGVAGIVRILDAPTPQTVNGTTYEFVSWSDGGARTHDISTPTTDTTYTATYRALPKASINDVSVTEGNSGTTNAVFTVSLSAASTQQVTVNYATGDGTATTGNSDYTPKSGTLTFAPNTTSQPVSVAVNGDTTVEPNESFVVNLTSPAGATILDGQGTATITNDDGAPPPTAEAVVWTTLVGVSANGNTLTKTAGSGWGSAGAVSTKTLPSGDGYVEVTASGFSNRMFGLGNGDSSQSYADIEYALYLVSGGGLEVYESGAFRGRFGSYGQNDKLQVAVASGVVKYKRNGTVLYTSLTAPTYPLLVDCSMHTQGGTLNAAMIGGNWGGSAPPPPPPPTGEAVVWTTLVGVSANGNTLTKTAASGWNAGAVSTKTLPSGDGHVEVTASTGSNRMFGLGNGDSSQSYTDVEYAFYLVSGSQLQVYEGGALRGRFGSYGSGDKLQVSVESGAVKYKRNGTVLYTSLTAPTYPLLVDCSIHTQGGMVNAAVIGGNWGGSPPPPPPPPTGEAVVWTTLVGVSANGNTLTKTAGSGWGNAGAVSTKSLPSGDGYVEVTASTGSNRMFGLGNGDSNQSFADIQYAFYLVSGGQLEIYESGAFRGSFGGYGSGDKLQISVESGAVKYKRNGSILYTSVLAPSYPLLVDSALHTQGATLNSATISGNWQ